MSLHEPQTTSETLDRLPVRHVDVDLSASELHPDDAHAAAEGCVEFELCVGDDEPDA